MEAIITELKERIVEQLNLEDVKPADIGTDDALFGEGLGLDSIDSLELIVLLDKFYGVKVASPEEGKKVFQSVRTLAEFIHSKKA